MSDQSKKQLTFFAQTSINQLTQHTCIHSQCVLFNLFTFASYDGQHMLIGTSISICMCFFCSVQAENIISEFQCSSMLQINNILWSMLLHCVYAGSVCELDSVCVRFFPWALQLPYVFRFNGMRFRQKSEDAHCTQAAVSFSDVVHWCFDPVFVLGAAIRMHCCSCVYPTHTCGLVHVFCFVSRAWKNRIAWVKVCMRLYSRIHW